MLFRRREAESFFERLRVSLWPRRSWSRSTRYVVHRIRRLSATPHAVALGFAAGVVVSCTPFLGFHLIMASLVAWIVGGSIVAAALGTFIGTGKPHIDLSKEIFQTDQLWPIVQPMTLGAVPIGLALGALSYFLVRPAVNAYQHRRRSLRGREAMDAR
jgi:uncharacterized protein (DUF2062 family)